MKADELIHSSSRAVPDLRPCCNKIAKWKEIWVICTVSRVAIYRDGCRTLCSTGPTALHAYRKDGYRH